MALTANLMNPAVVSNLSMVIKNWKLILVPLILFFTFLLIGTQITFRVGSTASSSTVPTYFPRILYVFISIGKHANRNDIILKNINYLVRKGEDCLVYAYVSQNQIPEIPQCRIIKLHNIRYVFFLKQIHPLLVKEYDYVHFVLDDVVHYPPMGHFNHTYFDVLKRNQIGYGSPALKGSYWTERGLGPKKGLLGRRTTMIEIQATTFHYSLYKCFYKLIDTETPSGWGIDMWFYQYCKDYLGPKMNGRALVDDMNGMAIADEYYIQHNPFNFASSHSGNTDDVGRQMRNFGRWFGTPLADTFPNDLSSLE